MKNKVLTLTILGFALASTSPLAREAMATLSVNIQRAQSVVTGYSEPWEFIYISNIKATAEVWEFEVLQAATSKECGRAPHNPLNESPPDILCTAVARDESVSNCLETVKNSV